jgi:hypothetical protein
MFCRNNCGDFTMHSNCEPYTCYINTVSNVSTTTSTVTTADNESNNISFHTNEGEFHTIRYSDDTPLPNVMFNKHFLHNFSIIDGDDIWSDTAESVYSYNGSLSNNIKDLWLISYNISYKTYTDSETPHTLGTNPIKLYVYIDGKRKFCRTYRNNRIKDDIILLVSPGNCLGFQLKPGQTLSQDITKLRFGQFSYIKFSRFNISPNKLDGIINPTS